MASLPAPDELQISVRRLVAFALMGGDLHQHRFGGVDALEGLRGHQKLQEARGPDYSPEVTVRRSHAADGFQLTIAGRIDGVFATRTPVVVEEIKTTRRPFEECAPEAETLHFGQAQLYAALYVWTHQLPGAVVQLTYFNLDSGRTSSRREYMDAESLEAFFQEMVAGFLAWAGLLHARRQARDAAAARLAFPFADYRAGQRRFAVEAYRTVRDGGRLFAQAPTGIGKTLGALYPALKALGEGQARRIFFLTARTSGAGAAAKALALLRTKGLVARTVVVTAKDKICVDAPCNPETCPYALGYYDRLRVALLDGFQHDFYDREAVTALGEKHMLCPFELSLDLADDADVIVCDYNYAFDPGAHLRRFFNREAEGNVLLIDEAHNLVDRGRDMYSAELSKRQLRAVREEVKDLLPEQAKAVASMERALSKQQKRLKEASVEEIVEETAPDAVLPSLMRFCRGFEKWLGEEQPADVPRSLRELYFQLTRFVRCAEVFDARFRTLYRLEGRGFRAKIQCLDAAHLLRRTLDLCRAVVYFSATLTPFPFYSRLLGGDADTPCLSLPSPFPPEHLRLLVLGHVSTYYKDRERSLNDLVAAVHAVTSHKPGNYLVFFPSYRYLELVADAFRAAHPDTELLAQAGGMNDAERLAFLQRFEADDARPLVGFAVMGGAFGEGIDLVGEALIGVVVVGVGLPMVCTERDLMRAHHDAGGEPGFAFAYQFPGMNRVLQTAGRVIRTAEDKGVVCLIDPRFSQDRYRALFPPWWRPRFCRRHEDLCDALAEPFAV